MVPGRCGINFKIVFTEHMLALVKWFSGEHHFCGESTLVQGMGWCRQADFCHNMASLDHSELIDTNFALGLRIG